MSIRQRVRHETLDTKASKQEGRAMTTSRGNGATDKRAKDNVRARATGRKKGTRETGRKKEA